MRAVFSGRFWVVLSLLVLSPLGGRAMVLGQSSEAARDALQNSNLPWYDAEADETQPIKIKASQGANEDHSKVPKKIKKASPTTSAAAPAGGGAGGGSVAGASALVWAATGILIMALLAVLLWAFFRLESEDVEGDALIKRRRATAEQIEALPFDMSIRDGDFRSLADQAYRNGDLRSAITFLFSHVLLSLDEKDLVRLRKGKTNRQYLAELRTHRPLADYYTRVMVAFEDTFFGDREIHSSDFESCWSGLDGFLNSVDQTGEAAIS